MSSPTKQTARELAREILANNPNGTYGTVSEAYLAAAIEQRDAARDAAHEAEMAAANARLRGAQEPAVCGGFGGRTRVDRHGCGVDRHGCGMDLWMSGTGASGYRCLNCRVVFCAACCKHHFEHDSGETKESLSAQLAEARAELESHANQEASWKLLLDDLNAKLAVARAELERARVLLEALEAIATIESTTWETVALTCRRIAQAALAAHQRKAP